MHDSCGPDSEAPATGRLIISFVMTATRAMHDEQLSSARGVPLALFARAMRNLKEQELLM